MQAQANHLAGQTAAYLVQHAGDPTDWHPWGATAFEKAAEAGKPVFLSVGYSSCHWCHVMQRESFRDAETAAFLNEHFVPVKVDREEHPEVDHLYQQYLVLASGGSGWPMNVFLTPELAPFYGGTFFPKQGSYAMQSFPAVLTGVARTWEQDRAQAGQAAANALEVLDDLQAPKPSPPLSAEDLDALAGRVLALEDRENGGLGGAPKSPQWPVLQFLLARFEHAGDRAALEAADRWVYAMLRGGLYDHVGGGVFRYTTDEEWTLPHFEKMLPDNAMLLAVLARLHRLSPSEELAQAARGTAAFLGRDLARPEGGWWSSLDAEAGGIEGAPYLWRHEELAGALSPEELTLAERHLGVTREGNRRGANVLTRRAGRAADSEAVDELLRRLASLLESRPKPRAIPNAPVDWNALAARGLLEAGRELGDDGMVRQGLAGLEALLASAEDGPGVPHLLGGRVSAPPLLADHAHLAAACLAAADVDGGPGYLASAERLVERGLELFEKGGVLHMTPAETELPVRPVAYDDVPVPSGMATLLGAFRRVRPDDRLGLEQLFAPLRAFVRHSPVAAGAALALATELVAADGR